MSPPPDLSDASDQDLVALARQDSEDARCELARRYQTPVYKRIYRKVHNHEQAEDLTQETFLKVFRALDTHPPERKVSAWIFTSAKNVTVDYLRRKEVTPLPLEISPDTTPPGKIKPSMMRVDYRTDSAATRVQA